MQDRYAIDKSKTNQVNFNKYVEAKQKKHFPVLRRVHVDPGWREPLSEFNRSARRDLLNGSNLGTNSSKMYSDRFYTPHKVRSKSTMI